MSAAKGFMRKFDEEGRFRDRDGVLDVVIMTSVGNRYPGKLHFNNGLCIRAEMEGGSPWAFPDNSPLDQIRFVLYFEGETPCAIYVDQGRIVHQNQVPERPTKQDFLTNLRVARNLFFHPQRVEADSATVDIGDVTDAVARAAIWLTPKSVAGYNAADFPELGLDRQDDLLVLARSLVPQYVPPYPAAPAEANLRRGVSTAYYALFHLIVGEAMIRIVADPTLRSRVARSFQHDKMQQVCQEYSRARLDNAGQLTMRSGAVIPVQLQDLGTAFVSLQNARHQADYDTGTTLTHE